MKKSEWVVTSMLTGGLLLSILHHNSVYRDQYRSREDCQTDWGDKPEHCQRGSGSYARYYYGPSYEDGARPRTRHPELVQQKSFIKRSGFGRSGARFSGGG